jgi:hypothetical protein
MRALAPALAVAWLLVVSRSAVYLIYPQSFFDSDQASFGLMAKHLVEGRAFPLFQYGQGYLLGVDAWLAAPWFVLLGPTVLALRLSIILTNLAVATALIAGFVRVGRMRPLEALVPASFFIWAPPLTAAWLVEVAANIGPFLYVPLLWFIRHRPIAFGALLAVGFLNREFTIYALPVVLAAEAIAGRLFTRPATRRWTIAAAAFAAVWLTVAAVRPVADLYGPGTAGMEVPGATGSQIQNILTRVAVVPSELPARAHAMAFDYLPRELGARTVPSTVADQGRDWMWWLLGPGLALAFARALWLRSRSREPGILSRDAGSAPPDPSFAFYLAGVGLVAALAVILTRPLAAGPIDRYMLLIIYLPIGIVGAHLTLEPRAIWKRAAIALVMVWSVFSGIDHARLAVRYWGATQPDHIQELADALVARGITVAQAGYWRAYKVTFIARERVKVATFEVVRIEEYQRLAREAGDSLVIIREGPEGACPGGESVGIWWLCPALQK